MNERKDEKWLDEQLQRTINTTRPEFNAQAWKRRFPQARAASNTPGGERIWMAGDYTCGDGGAGYGVADAVRAGLHAARKVQALLGR